MSWITGFTDNCWSTGPISHVPNVNVDSIYARLVKRNRCNLHDYQNQANNGAKSTSMADKTIFGLGRKDAANNLTIFL